MSGMIKEVRSSFKNLGSRFSKNKVPQDNVKTRVNKGLKVFGLNTTIFSSWSIS